MKLPYRHIAVFLEAGQHAFSRWMGYVGLGLGVVLLLASVQLYINISVLIKDKNPRKDGFDYISVTKRITNENMAENHSFTVEEIKELKAQSFIQDATPLMANNFLVKATGSSVLPFTTDLFLESIDNRFLDTIPTAFTWQGGQKIVPIIISSDYLELYNTVFAPSKDLPQFSEKSVSSVIFQLECYSVNGPAQIFKANVVGLSDRINSVLVPVNFLEWANKNLGNTITINPSRIFIKTKDANNIELLNFLQLKNYNINKDKTKFGRLKQVLQAIVSGLSAFGILIILLSMLLFSYYLQLVIARSKNNLQLLLTLGYSPGWLSKTVAKRWVPVYIGILLTALLTVAVFQWIFQQFALNYRGDLSAFLHWSVVLIAIVLLLLSIFINYWTISKQLMKL